MNIEEMKQMIEALQKESVERKCFQALLQEQLVQ